MNDNFNNLSDEQGVRSENEEINKEQKTAEQSAGQEAPHSTTAPDTEVQIGAQPEAEQSAEQSAEQEVNNPMEFTPVNFSPVEPVSDYKPMSRGLKAFSLVMAVVILATSACLAGYFAGKRTTNKPTKYDSVVLESRPKKTDEKTCAEVYQEVNKSIVGIMVYNTSGDGSQASGIIFSKDGYVITNDHIYAEVPSAKFKVYTHDGKEYDAKYVAGDKISDLAVLKIEEGEFTPAVFGNSDQLYYGQNVVAIGRPNDARDNSSITTGIVSAINRRVQTTSNYSARLIQTDSAINPGSSGGALVNMYGQVVGVTSSKLASVEYEGVGYAIPTTVMQRIVEELIKEGRVVSRAKLGVTYLMVDSVTAEINGHSNTGLLIDSVAEDSDLYGKLKKNDIITHINDIEITDDSIVLDIIEDCSAGDTITVTFITEKGKSMSVSAVLKANISESSFALEGSFESNSSESDKDIFDFPAGE